jgi:two-component system, OmpR family, phosphate regulon sensor histidine kinase PhoR
MNKFRSRLLFALITLIITVLVGLGLLLGQIFKSFYLHTFNERLEKEANLMTTIVDEEGIANKYLDTRLKTYSKKLDTRVTIMDESGTIIHDTEVHSHLIHNQDQFHKIYLKNKEKKTDFHVVDNEQGMYYYGVPLLKEDQVKGYVILSSPVGSLKKVNQQIWGLLIGSLGLALMVILLLGARITTQYTKPIEAATKVAMELAKGNYKARTYEVHHDGTGMLSQAINILARNLQDMKKAHEMQQDRLRTLIENMGSGLILIDGRGYINLVNKAYKEIFDIDPVDYLYRLYHEAFEHKEVIQIVEEIFMTEEKVRKQLLLPLKIERRHFEVYGAPIIGTNDEWKGIVLVFHDITELKKLEQMRKDFVANVSHELKTPITSIKGFTETLLDGAMKDEQTLEYFLTIILKESDRLQTLIQDLLELSKIEQQGFKLNIQPVNIKEILEEIMTILQSKANDKEIELSLISERDNIYISGDSYRLKQIFINIINNGIAYTPKGGKVTVTIEENQQNVFVHVEDTGIGIKEEEIPRIFERFYRVDKARNRNSGGTGLGLAIVKHLVEAHQGQIKVKTKLGEGTTFTVKLKKELLDLQ